MIDEKNAIITDEYGVMTEQGAVRFERSLAAPPETVWAYLTLSEHRAKWLAAGDMDLKIGGAVELIFENEKLCKPGDEAPEKYKHLGKITVLSGRITRCESGRLLSFVLTPPGEEASETVQSEVTFELRPDGDRTVLTLTESRLVEGDAKTGALAGWHAHLSVLTDRLAGRAGGSFWATYSALEEEYRDRL